MWDAYAWSRHLNGVIDWVKSEDFELGQAIETATKDPRGYKPTDLYQKLENGSRKRDSMLQLSPTALAGSRVRTQGVVGSRPN